MEEAIAEMVRDSLANPKLVQGKPRALLKRMTNFLVKLRNALNGSGFTSFEEIISNIGSGAIGGRERGVARSLVTSEKRGNLGYIDDPSLLVERGKFADPDSTRLGIAMADEPDIQRTPNVGAPAEQPAGTVGAPRQADFREAEPVFARGEGFSRGSEPSFTRHWVKLRPLLGDNDD